MPNQSSSVIAIYNMHEILGITGFSKEKSVVKGVEEWWYALEGGGWVFGSDVSVN